MWPILVLAFFAAGCNRIFESKEEEKRKEETPPAKPSASLPPTTVTLTPKMLETKSPPCGYTRDQFIEISADPSQMTKKSDQSSFAGCYARLSDAKIWLARNRSNKQDELTLLEKAAFHTVLGFHGYKVTGLDGNDLRFFFRPDFPVLKKDFESAMERIQNSSKTPQRVYVQFDFKKAFTGKGIDEKWLRGLEDEVFKRIVKTYQGEDGKALPKLTLSREKPKGAAPYTTVLISDQSFEALIQKNPARLKEALKETFFHVSGGLILDPAAKDFALREFRKKHAVPENISEENLLDFVVKNRNPDLGRPGLDGIDLRRNPFEMEFGNPHLEEEVFVFVDSMKRGGLIDAILALGSEKAQLPLARILAVVASHELGHALGLQHLEEKNNLMVGGNRDMDPRRDDSVIFNDFQRAYLKTLFGE